MHVGVGNKEKPLGLGTKVSAAGSDRRGGTFGYLGRPVVGAEIRERCLDDRRFDDGGPSFRLNVNSFLGDLLHPSRSVRAKGENAVADFDDSSLEEEV